jgi:hypothetical protein
VDVGFDRRRNQVADGEPLSHAPAQVGGRDVQRWRVEPDQPLTQAGQDLFQRCQGWLVSRARHHSQPGQPHDAGRIAPGEELGQAVPADQEEQLCLRVLPPQQGQHLDRVVGTGAVQVDAGKHAGGIVGDGRLHHRRAVVGRGDRAVGLVGRLPGHDEEDAVEPKLHTRRLGQDEVPVVGRVEGAPDDAKS